MKFVIEIPEGREGEAVLNFHVTAPNEGFYPLYIRKIALPGDLLLVAEPLNAENKPGVALLFPLKKEELKHFEIQIKPGKYRIFVRNANISLSLSEKESFSRIVEVGPGERIRDLNLSALSFF